MTVKGKPKVRDEVARWYETMRGGRESGETSIAESRVLVNDSAAADPAAPNNLWCCGLTEGHLDGCPCQTRIRALEASNEANREAWTIAENKVAALEAELADETNRMNAEHEYYEQQKARAEKAEAEVERLKARDRDAGVEWPDEGPDERTEDC